MTWPNSSSSFVCCSLQASPEPVGARGISNCREFWGCCKTALMPLVDRDTKAVTLPLWEICLLLKSTTKGFLVPCSKQRHDLSQLVQHGSILELHCIVGL